MQDKVSCILITFQSIVGFISFLINLDDIIPLILYFFLIPQSKIASQSFQTGS